jgi:glutamyl/glutaminyl-tRNA synthetase
MSVPVAAPRGMAADDPAIVADYCAQLKRAYGGWERARGTAHSPEAWEQILRSAVALESASVDEMVALSAFAFVERVTRLTPEAASALGEEHARLVLRRCRDTLSPEALHTPEAAKDWLRDLRHTLRDEQGLRGKLVMFPLRAAWTGAMVGPCLGIVASLLGYTRCCQRLEDQLLCHE